MEITRIEQGNVLELHIEGRLDAYWADHLSEEMSTVVREGRHFISLNLSKLTYISSAGISVLVRFYKQLQSLDGKLAVIDPSNPVKDIFKLTGLQELLNAPPAKIARKSDSEKESLQAIELASANMQLYTLDKDASMSCRIVGNPAALTSCSFEANDCRSVDISTSAFAIGLGALGRDFDDCRSRFGEFIAVGGAAAYQPTDTGNVPDYLVSPERTTSGLQVLYALHCEGGFSHVLTFESKQDQTVSLLDMTSKCRELTKSDAAAIVMIAETAGLVGAALRRSPAVAEVDTDLFSHPEIRDWMTFTAEPAFVQGVTLVAGVVSQHGPENLGPIVRPLGEDPWPVGHFHAAAFTYRPLRKGRVALGDTVTSLFEEEMLNGILDLINDTRPIVGVGQSQFVRGTCWIAPVSSMERVTN